MEKYETCYVADLLHNETFIYQGYCWRYDNPIKRGDYERHICYREDDVERKDPHFFQPNVKVRV